MPVLPGNFGVQDFTIPAVSESGGSCDYPDAGDVRDGVSYDSGNLVGTLTLPDEGDVRSGVDYGAAGTEFEGTLTFLFPGPDPDPETYSPADITRYLIISLGLGSLPAAGQDNADWGAYENREPPSPDNVITTYDTAGPKDGRAQIDGSEFAHPGVQIRVRSTNPAVGYKKIIAVADALATQVRNTSLTIGSVTYKVRAVSRTGNVIDLGKDAPTSKRTVHVVNVKIVYDVC